MSMVNDPNVLADDVLTRLSQPITLQHPRAILAEVARMLKLDSSEIDVAAFRAAKAEQKAGVRFSDEKLFGETLAALFEVGEQERRVREAARRESGVIARRGYI